MTLLSVSSFREPSVAIEASKGQQTLAELSTKFELTQQQISTWKREFLSKSALVFTQEVPEKVRDKELQSLYAKIKFPYLLRGLEIDHCNQVWEMDITYIPMKKGFMYLAAIIEVFSRYIVGWGISNTMDTEWCMGIVQEAFRKHGRPEIFNTDQGSQFTSKDFTDMLIGDDESNPLVRISRDGHPHSSLDYKQPSKLYYKNAA